MKAAKVAIAAAVVAALFLAVPFASVVSDAAWAEDKEGAVYFESDPDKITWAAYKELLSITDEQFAEIIVKLSGIDTTLNTYKYSGMEFSNIALKGGNSASLCDKSLTKTSVRVSSIDYKFTITADTVSSTFFNKEGTQLMKELITYLGLEEGKLKVGDKIEFSGTMSGESMQKSITKYKDIDEEDAALYYHEFDQLNVIDITQNAKYISGDTEKTYDQVCGSIDREQNITAYEMDDDEEKVSMEKYYLKAVVKSQIKTGTMTFTFDDKECTPTPTNTVIGGTNTSYEKYTDRYAIAGVVYPADEVTYKKWLNSSMDEAQIKAKLDACGTTSDSYSSVDDLFESYFNPSEPEPEPVNQGLFFGAFIAILVIAVVIAAIFRVKK